MSSQPRWHNDGNRQRSLWKNENVSTRLFCGGLAWATDDASLRAAFEPFGTITDARVVMDRETGRSRGFGFVGFSTEEEAARAAAAMDGADVDQRAIRVNVAEERSSAGRPRPSGGPSYGGGPSVTSRGPSSTGDAFSPPPRRSPPPPRLPPPPGDDEEPEGKPMRRVRTPGRERIDPSDRVWTDAGPAGAKKYKGKGKGKSKGRGSSGRPSAADSVPTGRKKSRPEAAWESWEEDFDI